MVPPNYRETEKHDVLHLHSFAIAVVTNYHKVGGSKQHTFILLQFWESEVQDESWGRKLRCQQGLQGHLDSLTHGPFPPSSKPVE